MPEVLLVAALAVERARLQSRLVKSRSRSVALSVLLGCACACPAFSQRASRFLHSKDGKSMMDEYVLQRTVYNDFAKECCRARQLDAVESDGTMQATQ